MCKNKKYMLSHTAAFKHAYYWSDRSVSDTDWEKRRSRSFLLGSQHLLYQAHGTTLALYSNKTD